MINNIKYLISKGVSVHSKNNYALSLVIHKGHLEIVKYLVSLGIYIHIYNNYAFRMAARRGNLEIVKFLVTVGANIHDEYAFICSAGHGHIEVTK